MKTAQFEYLGAIYLFGYSVELRLKAAYFINAGFGNNQPISKADRKTAVDMYSVLGLLVPPGQHDIAGWAQLAVAARATCPAPYGAFGIEIVSNAQAIPECGEKYCDIAPQCREAHRPSKKRHQARTISVRA